MAKRRIQAARIDVAAAHAALLRDWRPWREAWQRHRSALIVASGFAGGLALSSLSPRLWARVGVLAAAGAALVARSVLVPMIAGAVIAKNESAGKAADTRP
jgi:hypothetical protein